MEWELKRKVESENFLLDSTGLLFYHDYRAGERNYHNGAATMSNATMMDTTIRLRGVYVYPEEERDRPHLWKMRWQVPVEDEAQDAFLHEIGYPSRIAAEDVGDLIIEMNRLGNTVVFEPGGLVAPDRGYP